MMTQITFEDDPSSRKISQFLLLMQIAGMTTVVGSIVFHLYSVALLVSFMTFIIFIAIILWLYLRYRSTPVVQEKHNLKRRVLDLQNSIRTEGKRIQLAKQKRDSFSHSEQTEIDTILSGLQQDHIQKGLASSYIKDAIIPGVGPKLKERLLTHGIATAVHINNRISEIPGFGEAKIQAIVHWRSLVYAQFDNSKPLKLSNEQLESIKQKYEGFHSENDASEKNARENKQNLENNLNSLQTRLDQLSLITFATYLSKSLASRRVVAAIIAFLLIICQVISGVTATASTIVASLPTLTATPTITFTPTNTFTPTVTSTLTITHTLTITSTPTITYTPTITFTPTVTFTPSRTRTLIPTKTSISTIDPLQNVTAICNDGTYSYSQSQQGTCSGHGGVKQWIHKPPK